MRPIDSLSELNLPVKYEAFIQEFLENVADNPNVEKVVLFGSCAKGTMKKNSDIDLFVMVNRELAQNEEFYIMYECVPPYDSEIYVESDVIVGTEEQYYKHINTTGMVQKYIELYGVDLSGLLPKCREMASWS